MAYDILWDGITSGTDTGDVVEGKLTTTFAATELALNELDVATADNSSNIVLVEGRVTVLETPPAYVDLEPQASVPTYTEGRFFYNSVTDTFDIMGPFEGIVVSPGHGEHLHVVNNSGILIEAGSAVRIAGASGGIPQIVKAIADTFSNATVAGIAVIDIPIGAESAISVSGFISFDTSLLPVAVPLFLSDTVAGTYTSTAPAIRTQIGGVLVADATVGRMRVSVEVNQITPSVLGGLKGQNSPIYDVTTTAQDIADYALTREVVTTVDDLLGKITLPNDGDYRVNFTASITFPSSISTRTVYLELYDETGATIHFTYPYNVPRDATEGGLSFTWTLEEAIANIHKMRIRSSIDIEITFTEISFDIQSISII